MRDSCVPNAGAGGESTPIPCFRCGDCCSRYQVRMDLADARNIADNLGLSWEVFCDRYLDQRWPGTESFLLARSSRGCVFLEMESNNPMASCSIHSFRPSSCRDWTPDLFRRECKAGLAKWWGLAVTEEGTLAGPPDKIKAFEAFMESL